MSGYYPDGVTGNELAIAGPEREYEGVRWAWCKNEDCRDFEVEGDMEMSLASYGHQEWGTWVCNVCETTNDYEADIEPEEEDPDEAYERYRESMDAAAEAYGW